MRIIILVIILLFMNSLLVSGQEEPVIFKDGKYTTSKPMSVDKVTSFFKILFRVNDMGIFSEFAATKLSSARVLNPLDKPLVSSKDLLYFSIPRGSQVEVVAFGETYEESTEIPLDFEGLVASVSFFGEGEVLSEEGYARVIITDVGGNEYLVFGSDSMVLDGEFSVENICEETCNLGGIQIKSLNVEVKDAYILVEKIQIQSKNSPTMSKLLSKAQFRSKQHESKVNFWDSKIRNKGLMWTAGETSFSKLSYAEKKKFLTEQVGTPVDELPNLAGFEYYKGGVFSFPKYQKRDESICSDIEDGICIKSQCTTVDDYDCCIEGGYTWEKCSSCSGVSDGICGGNPCWPHNDIDCCTEEHGFWQNDECDLCHFNEDGFCHQFCNEGNDIDCCLQAGFGVENSECLFSVPERYDLRNYQGIDWNTPVKTQGGVCNHFAKIGMLETNINLYYNDPEIDMDLSEEYIKCFFPYNKSDPMGYLLHFYALQNEGVVDEECLPMLSCQPCSESCLCFDYEDRLWKYNGSVKVGSYPRWNRWFDPITSSTSEEDQKGIKLQLLKYGAAFSANSLHSTALVGYGTDTFDEYSWQVEETCASGLEVCYINECVATDYCIEEGATACSSTSNTDLPYGSTQYICQNGEWVLNQECGGGEYCYGGNCVDSDEIPIDCAPDERGCKGKRVVKCTNKFPYWIIKNSWGSNWGDDGFGYIEMSGLYRVIYMANPEIIPSVISPQQIQCTDRDNDGYCYWGLSEEMPDTCSASCQPEKDCDDSDPTLGPFDVDYSCIELSSLECVDSDGGKYVHVPGTTCVGDECEKDYCVHDNERVFEYYCQGDSTKRTPYDCAMGCSNGACIGVTPKLCSDPDDTESNFLKSLYTKTTVTTNTREQLGDTCLGNDSPTVREYRCDELNQIAWTNYICPNGCSDGACISEGVDRCYLLPEQGPCRASITRYYFDQRRGICKRFIWGGCEGTVPFDTLEECRNACDGDD